MSFAVKKGTKYRILVAGVKDADGKFKLRWSLLSRWLRWRSR